jgi:hypothetical protein
MQGIPVFITEKTMVEMFNLPETSITKLTTKPIKKKDKEKKGAIFWKIVSLEALVNREGWN